MGEFCHAAIYTEYMESSTLLQGHEGVPLERAGTLYKVVLGILAFYIAAMALGGQGGSKIVAPILIFALSAVTLWLHARGQVVQAMTLFVWGIWAAVSLQAWLRNGVANAALFAYPAMVLLGGWVLGIRQGAALGFASIAASFLLAVAEMQGWIVGRRIDTHVMWYWAPQALVILSTLVAMHFILRAHWNNIRTMRVLNQELELVVATLTAREQALQRSEARFHIVSDSNPLPIAVSRVSDGCYMAINPAWQREFGWTEEEAIDHTSVELGIWEDVSQRNEWVRELLREGRTMNRSIVCIARDGRKVHLIISAESIEYDGHACVLAIFMDQTERLRSENEIKVLNEKLETRVEQRTAELSAALISLKKAQEELVHSEKLASLGQLVAGVAHELNTPLGNALITTSALGDATRAFESALKEGNIKRSTLDHFVKQSLEGTMLAERSLHRASDLVRSFKQVAVDQTSERRRDFDLAEAVNEVVDTLRPNLKGTHVQVQIDIAPGIRMESFPGPLGQVVINLVMNAVLHAFEGRTDGLVTIRAKLLKDGNMALECADNGCGIAPEHLSRIFDPFFTTRLGQGGSGLGLAIVHRLVTQVLGGQISVDSSGVEGSAFLLRLPLVAPNTEI
jgi:PAS domain S-box-containing protein